MSTHDEEHNQNDSELVAQHRAGDPAAFEALYNAYYHRLLRFIRKRVHEDHLVEDMAQEAFARAFAAIDGLRETDRFYPWLSMITRRLIIDHYRQRKRISLVADLDPGVSDAPEGLLLEQEAHAEVGQAMDRLRGRHQEVLQLREFHGMSYEQIAAKLNVPATTVPPLLYRARVALRREYFLLTEHEGTAIFVPVLVFFTGAFRRIRDRVTQVAAYLPDPQALSGSIAAVVVGVGGWLAPAVAAAAFPDLVGPDAPPAVTNAHAPSSDAERQAGSSRADSPPQSDPDGSLAPVPGYRPDVALDHAGARRGREADRHMPHYIQPNDLSVGVDPDAMRRDIEASLGGDYGWMEQQ